MASRIKSAIILVAMLISIFGIALFAKAGSYDVYVDKSYDKDDSDGSSDKPYKKIEDALGKGDKIYIKSGTYEERVSLPSGTELTGEDKSKVTIKGSAGLPAITAKKNNSLKNITVTGGHTGILFEGKGSMENCAVKNVTGDAISLAEGSGTVTIKKSTMSGNTKGFYAQKGSSYNISGSTFENNKGEGIDIREDTSGSISGNSIIGNKEGGIEIVVGSSNVSITNNTIKKNKASGIAAQFYSQAKKTGEIQISKNTVSYNGIFGIACKAPSGGDTPKGYYNKSLELADNKIENNKRKSISATCKIIEAVTEEEEKQNQAIESETADDVPEEESIEEEEKIEGEEETKQKQEEEIRMLSESLSQINTDWQVSTNKSNQNISEIKSRNKIKFFFIGPDYSKIRSIKSEIATLEKIKNSLFETYSGFEALQNAENMEKTRTAIEELENQIENQKLIITQEENRFSLSSWTFKIFKKLGF